VLAVTKEGLELDLIIVARSVIGPPKDYNPPAALFARREQSGTFCQRV
jgi:hypothetical protein